MRHRGSANTRESYKGTPIDAGLGVHQAVVDSLKEVIPFGARVADIGAGRGALSHRLSDAGFQVVAFDLDNSEWSVQGIECNEADVNTEDGMQTVISSGPYDAIVSIEVIEHLESPRQFLRNLLRLAERTRAPIVFSTPNPLDTFSAISFFRRGVFNWFSPAHYVNGGHISILPHWLIMEHLKHLGVEPCRVSWKFLSPWRAKGLFKRLLYFGVQTVHRFLIRSSSVDYTNGQSAVVLIAADPERSDI